MTTLTAQIIIKSDEIRKKTDNGVPILSITMKQDIEANESKLDVDKLIEWKTDLPSCSYEQLTLCKDELC